MLCCVELYCAVPCCVLCRAVPHRVVLRRVLFCCVELCRVAGCCYHQSMKEFTYPDKNDVSRRSLAHPFFIFSRISFWKPLDGLPFSLFPPKPPSRITLQN